MKIVHFVENLERGGLERAVIDLALAQRDAGHSCAVVCLFEAGVLADELVGRGVPVHACGKRPGADLRALLRARATLRQHPGAILHSHNPVAHYHAALSALGTGMRCLVNTRHGMGSGRSRTEHLYRATMPLTEHVVGVCESVRLRLEQRSLRPRGGLHAIPNGIPVERFSPANAEARMALRRTLGLAADARVIGTIGRLSPVKDQITLLKAFARVLAIVPDAALVIVGEGPQRQALEEAVAAFGIGQSVRLMGDRSDVPALLGGFDVFALTSTSEGYSVALLEACASALPIVASDVGGNREIVRDRVNGLLVPASDVVALSDALVSVLEAPGMAAAMGQQGRAWALAEASLQTMVRRYLDLYVARPLLRGVAHARAAQ